MQSSTNTLNLPTHEGANLAPLRPLLKLREHNKNTSHYIADALKEKYSHFIKKDEKSWREMIGRGQQIALFIEGQQILDFNPFTQSYAPRKLKKTDPNRIKAVNFMQYYCTNWQSKWESSNPDIVVSAMSNQDQAISKARKANAVIDYLERNFYDSWYNLHEGLMAQVWGWYGNQVVIDRSIQGSVALRNIIEDREVPIGRGFGKCYDCEQTGSEFNFVQIGEADMPVCPECGSTAVQYEPPPMQLMPTVVGQEQVNLGDVVCNQLYFPACRWDLRQRLEDSRWAIFEQDVPNGTLKRMLGDIDIPEGTRPNEFGLDAIADLAKTGAADTQGRSSFQSATRKDSSVISEMYLSPDDYADIVIKGDEETIAGQSLPKGSRLTEVFPDGLCAVGVNGMALVLGLYAGTHKDTVTSGVYHMKPMSGAGRGVQDAVEIQKRFNRFDSQATRFMATRATPATLHMEGAIASDKRRLLGQPDVDIPVKMQNFPEVRDIRQLVAPLQGESVPGDMLNYTYQHLQNFMQLAYHITDFSNGLNPRVQNDTATGAEILDANANALFSPSLSIKGDVRLKTAKKAFYLWIKNNPEKRFVPVSTGASLKGLNIAGADVDGEYYWEIVPGSTLPKNKLSRRKDAESFYFQFGGIVGYCQTKAMFPEEVAEARRLWDMDLPRDEYDSIGELCRARFENAKMMVQQATQTRQQVEQATGLQIPLDMSIFAQSCEPSIEFGEGKFNEKVVWFQNLLDTDEGQTMGRELRSLVTALILIHQQMAGMQAGAIATQEAGIADSVNQPMEERANAREDANAEKEHKRTVELEKVKAKNKAKAGAK